MTLKFDGWLWKTIGHLSFDVSSFVQHFIAIGEFKLELQSGNVQFESNSTIFFSCVTLKFDRWHLKTKGHHFYATSSFVHHFVAIGELKLELQSGNAQFGSNSTIFRAVWLWNSTDDLEKQQGTSSMLVENAQFGSKSTIFFSRVTLKFNVWPWKTLGHLFYVASSFVQHSITIGEFKLELQSGNAQFGSN